MGEAEAPKPPALRPPASLTPEPLVQQTHHTDDRLGLESPCGRLGSTFQARTSQQDHQALSWMERRESHSERGSSQMLKEQAGASRELTTEAARTLGGFPGLPQCQSSWQLALVGSRRPAINSSKAEGQGKAWVHLYPGRHPQGGVCTLVSSGVGRTYPEPSSLPPLESEGWVGRPSLLGPGPARHLTMVTGAQTD